MHERYRSRSAKQALGHVIEEMGEALAAAGKTMRWGPRSSNPELPFEQREINMAWLLRELKDVENAITAFRELVDQGPVDAIRIWQLQVDSELKERHQ